MAPINILLCHHVNQICLKCELTGACVTPTVRDDRTRPVKKVVRLPQRMPYLTYCLWHHGYCGFIVGMLLVGLIPSQYFFYLCSSKSCLFTFFFLSFQRSPHFKRRRKPYLEILWTKVGIYVYVCFFFSTLWIHLPVSLQLCLKTMVPKLFSVDNFTGCVLICASWLLLDFFLF